MKTVLEIMDAAYIADAHLDLAYDILKKHSFGRMDILETDYYPDLVKGCVNLIISSIYIDNDHVPELALKEGIRQIEILREEIEASEHFCIVTDKKTLREAKKSKKIGILICFEGIAPIGDDLMLLRAFRRLGLRGVGICWARRNQAADGSLFIHPKKGGDNGLTPFGYSLIESAKANDLYIDLAHINDRGFWDAIKVLKHPPMVSHTNARALNQTDRNLTDEQMHYIIDKQGFIGINAMNFTVSDGLSIPEDVKGFVRHILYVLALGGEDSVGLGLDFNDFILSYIAPSQLALLPREPFDCIKGYHSLPLIVSALLESNVTEDIICKILGGNLYRYLEMVLPEGGVDEIR